MIWGILVQIANSVAPPAPAGGAGGWFPERSSREILDIHKLAQRREQEARAAILVTLAESDDA